MVSLALIGTVGLVGLVVLAFVGGAAFSYLFLRANPQKKAAVDAEVNKVSAKL